MDMSSFESDGAAVLSGNKNGVWTKLKAVNSSLITNHCKDHRLALACKDSYKSLKTMKRLDDMLDNVHKYYKYSANRTKTLEEVQKALEQPVLKVKKAKHHRWLSHGKAVKSIVESYKALICDLESHSVSGDPVGNGILKTLKDPVILKTLLLLADVLPQLDQLSLFFQRRDVHLGMVKTVVDKTVKFMEKKKTEDGPWLRKLSSIAEAGGIDLKTISLASFTSSVREPFLSVLIDNIQSRFEDSGIMDKLSLMDLSLYDEIPATYGLTDMMDIADHFQMDSDTLAFEWDSFITFIGDQPPDARSIPNSISLLLNDKLGLGEMYPLILRLLSVAFVIPLSTAEVERVFFQVKLIKTEHRNRLKQLTLENILKIKINCGKELFSSILNNVVLRFFSEKKRRID